MNAIYFFGPVFNRFGCATAHAHHHLYPQLRVHGVVAGSNELTTKIRAALGTIGGEFLSLADYESSWLKQPVSPTEIASFERRFPRGTLGRLLVADRRVGAGFVRAGTPRVDDIARSLNRLDEQASTRYVLNLVIALDRFFDRTNPSFVFAYAVAGAPALALYLLARERGIPFATLKPARIAGRYLVDTDPDPELRRLEHRYSALWTEPPSKEAIGKAETYLRNFRNNPRKTDTQRETEQAAEKSLTLRGIVIQSIQSGVRDLRRYGWRSVSGASHLKARRALQRLQISRRRARLRTSGYFSDIRDIQRNFVYYPLHVEPEASTSVLAPDYVNQLYVIEQIAKSLNPSEILVVKEHTPMLGARPNDFYAVVGKIPNVILVDPLTSTHELIQTAQTTVTITGTAAFEAMLFGKIPVLLKGNGFSFLDGGFVRAPDLTKLSGALEAARTTPALPDQTIVLALAHMFDVTIPIPKRMLWASTRRISDEDLLEVGTLVARELVKVASNYRASGASLR